MMTSGGETTDFEDIVYDWGTSQILGKLYRQLDLDPYNNEADHKTRAAIEEAVYQIVKQYV